MENKTKECTACRGRGAHTYTYRAAMGNPYSYNYEPRQDYETVTETRKCTLCEGTGKVKK